jgi:3-oxoacyl-[acyl-carrier-protein] synthase-1
MGESALASAAGEAITGAFLPTIDDAIVGAERVAILAEPPLREAAAKLDGLRIEAMIAVDEGAPMEPLASVAKRALPGADVKVEPAGEAALASWIPAAAQALAARRVDAVILGGAHSDHDPAIVAALEAGGRLFSRDTLDARIPGEAAAFVVLMRAFDAAARGLAPMARVLGHGQGRERARPDNDVSAYEALGLTAAVREATAPLERDGRTAGWLLTDLTFEMWRQEEWQSVWVRSQKVIGAPWLIESPAQRIGFLGAAALPLFVVMTSMAWSHGHAPSPLALALAGSDSGARAALALGAP